MAPGSRNLIEATDLEEFRQNIFGKDSCNLGIDKGIDKTVPIKTSSSLLGQNIYTDIAYPFINEWQCGWTDISNGSFGMQGNGSNQTTQQLCAESVPIQTWSSQLGQQICTDLATPFINEWQAGERANGCGGPAIAIEVDWESFVFTVPIHTPLPKSSPIDGQYTCSDTSFSDKSVAPDGRFLYRSEADEAELGVDWGQSCSSGDSEDTDTDTDTDTDKSSKDTDTEDAPSSTSCQKTTIEERTFGSSQARLCGFFTVSELRACRTACCRSFMAATTAIIT